LLAKLCDYRVDFTQNAHALRNPPQHSGPFSEWSRMASNISDRWRRLWDLNELWRQNRPRSMAQMGMVRVEDLRPAPGTTRSAFPKTTFPSRTAVVAALFYYTTKLILSKCNPIVILEEGTEAGERLMKEMDEEEVVAALTICSITAHTQDRGVASVAIQALHHAAETLDNPAEQNEVLAIFERISRTAGWRIDYIIAELMQRWNRTPSQLTMPMPTTSTPLIPVTAALAGLSMTLPPLNPGAAASPPSLGSSPAFFKLAK